MPSRPFTDLIKKLAEMLGIKDAQGLPGLQDSRTKDAIWNGTLTNKCRSNAGKLYEGLWELAGGSKKCNPNATIHKEVLELLNTKESFQELAASQFSSEASIILCKSPNQHSPADSLTRIAAKPGGGLALFELFAAASAPPEFKARDAISEDELHAVWVVDCGAYGEHSITFEQFRKQWRGFPHFPKAIFYGGAVAAAIGIMPVKRELVEQFASGAIPEAEIQNQDLSSFMSGGVSVWLIDGIVRNPAFPRSVTRELVTSSILSWIDDSLMKYPMDLFAIGQNVEGMNLITRFGFKLVVCGESLPDGLPLFHMPVASESELLRLLLARLA